MHVKWRQLGTAIWVQHDSCAGDLFFGVALCMVLSLPQPRQIVQINVASRSETTAVTLELIEKHIPIVIPKSPPPVEPPPHSTTPMFFNSGCLTEDEMHEVGFPLIALCSYVLQTPGNRSYSCLEVATATATPHPGSTTCRIQDVLARSASSAIKK